MKKILLTAFIATLGLFNAAEASDKAKIINNTGVTITISYKHNGINTTTQNLETGKEAEIPLKYLTIKTLNYPSNWNTKLIISGTPKARDFKITKGKTWNNQHCLAIDRQYDGLEVIEENN